jgi:hypothetical protein
MQKIVIYTNTKPEGLCMWSCTIVIYPQLSYASSTKLFFLVGGILLKISLSWV